MKGWRPGWFIPLGLCFATSLAAAEALRGESPEARAALDRAVEFIGGTQVVYGMRTLVIASDNTRHHDGREIIVPTRTYYAFPLSVRQEITLNSVQMRR